MRILWMMAVALAMGTWSNHSWSWIGVPPPFPGGPVFQAGQQKEAGALRVEGGNGARLVAFENVVITGSAGARVRIAAPDGGNPVTGPPIVLMKGAFVVHVGSSPQTVAAGRAVLTLKSASLFVMKSGPRWLFHAAEVGEGGQLDLVVTSRQKMGDGDAEVQLEHRLELKRGDSCQLPDEAKPKKATKAEVRQLFPVIAALFWKSGEKKLVLADVEDPADLLPPQSQMADREDSPEIDGIEIELDADCVEVCVD